MSQKEILDGKVRCIILRIIRWKCNLFSLSSCHEFCKRFTTTPYTLYLHTLTKCSHKCVWWDSGVLDLYMCSCARIRTYIQCISHSLWLGAIRKLYSKRLAFNLPGETRRWRNAMECWSSYYRRVFDASFDAVDQENGKRIRSLARGYWEKIWILNCGITTLMLRKFVAISDSKCVKWSCYWMW